VASNGVGFSGGTIVGESGGGARTLASDGGGVCEGCDDGGEMDVISREGERGRLMEDCELGDGVSSGGGGGGRTKWNVRDAICICDLEGMFASGLRCILESNDSLTFPPEGLVSRRRTTRRQPRHRCDQ
jgi:hypothetical protein